MCAARGSGGPDRRARRRPSARTGRLRVAGGATSGRDTAEVVPQPGRRSAVHRAGRWRFAHGRVEVGAPAKGRTRALKRAAPADPRGRRAHRALALVSGWDDTRATLRRWRAAATSVGRGRSPASHRALRATTTWVRSGERARPGTSPPRNGRRDDSDSSLPNGLVLALQTRACVAGFIAGRRGDRAEVTELVEARPTERAARMASSRRDAVIALHQVRARAHGGGRRGRHVSRRLLMLSRSARGTRAVRAVPPARGGSCQPPSGVDELLAATSPRRRSRYRHVGAAGSRSGFSAVLSF